MNAVHHDVVGSELRCGETACDIGAVIVAPQSKIMIKDEILNQSVRFDCARKVRAQHAPCFVVLAPGLNQMPKPLTALSAYLRTASHLLHPGVVSSRCGARRDRLTARIGEVELTDRRLPAPPRGGGVLRGWTVSQISRCPKSKGGPKTAPSAPLSGGR